MGILQVRIVEWVAMLSSRGSLQARDQTQVSLTAGRFFTVWATKEVSVVNEGPYTINAPFLWNSDLCYLNREFMAFSFLFFEEGNKKYIGPK